jgi:hypothetical protein
MEQSKNPEWMTHCQHHLERLHRLRTNSVGSKFLLFLIHHGYSIDSLRLIMSFWLIISGIMIH